MRLPLSHKRIDVELSDWNWFRITQWTGWLSDQVLDHLQIFSDNCLLSIGQSDRSRAVEIKKLWDFSWVWLDGSRSKSFVENIADQIFAWERTVVSGKQIVDSFSNSTCVSWFPIFVHAKQIQDSSDQTTRSSGFICQCSILVVVSGCWREGFWDRNWVSAQVIVGIKTAVRNFWTSLNFWQGWSLSKSFRLTASVRIEVRKWELGKVRVIAWNTTNRRLWRALYIRFLFYVSALESMIVLKNILKTYRWFPVLLERSEWRVAVVEWETLVEARW